MVYRAMAWLLLREVRTVGYNAKQQKEGIKRIKNFLHMSNKEERAEMRKKKNLRIEVES